MTIGAEFFFLTSRKPAKIHSNKEFDDQADALNKLQSGFSVLKNKIELFEATFETQKQTLDKQIPGCTARVDQESGTLETRVTEQAFWEHSTTLLSGG